MLNKKQLIGYAILFVGLLSIYTIRQYGQGFLVRTVLAYVSIGTSLIGFYIMMYYNDKVKLN